MATASVEESSSKALKCQTWVLKVSIHCQGCKRKVKKVLLGMDGVYTATIDSQQQRVTVIGNIEVETLIKRLIKTGKHAEIWPENFPSKEKESGRQKNMQKQNDSSNNEKRKTVRFSGGTKDVGQSAENSTVSEELPEVKNNASENEGVSGVKNRGNKKKKKGQNRDNSNSHSASASPSTGKSADTAFQTHGMGMNQAMGPSNFSPTRHQSVPYPQVHNIPLPYASTYRMAYPREYSYPSPFIYAPLSPYPKVTPLDSFFYFSDENAQGCSIM